ncbi:GIY-YIG nuclease family protein [Hydrogenophaga sp.]|uniref:GIY-YIG nuclease family protein n=1 Tax=Hydrogenophaga sp. TaxID=1904254 RepID=UPI002719904B|nr:GIY-YIG nuclease family protein [Hydrogenophaga sp.]MDO9437713.1 GIY-YIG nuclease family protein [Hydrogenophaga sp.]
MHPEFSRHLETLHPSLERLLGSDPLRYSDLARASLPQSGVYLFTEDGRHLYVGRSNSVKKRLQNHCGPSSGENKAAFAFLLTRDHTNNVKPSYRSEGSRKHLMTLPDFRDAFATQKARLLTMDIRVVEEPNPYRQAMLEMYAAVALGTPFNRFDNH